MVNKSLHAIRHGGMLWIGGTLIIVPAPPFKEMPPRRAVAGGRGYDQSRVYKGDIAVGARTLRERLLPFCYPTA